MQPRSDDFIDGLQIAYKLAFTLHEKAALPTQKYAYLNMMRAIQEQIDNASVDKPRIIVP
jgi:hypothetical protein